MVASFIEALFSEVMAKAAGLGKTLHSADAVDVYPSVGCGLLMELIFLNDFLQDVAEFDLCEFGSFEWCHEVEIGKVDAHKMRVQCGNYTVEEYFDKEERGRVGANVVGIVDEVPAHGCTWWVPSFPYERCKQILCR